MRYIPALAALLLLAACSGDGGDITRPVSAEFAPADTETAGAAIEVTVEDRQPVETAELVAPDGSATPAHQIDRSRIVEHGAAQPSIGVGVFGGSSGRVGGGVGIGFPMGSSGSYDRVIDSRALIRVPDMAAYRQGWQDWKIRIRLGTTETNERVMEIPAPRPPEG